MNPLATLFFSGGFRPHGWMTERKAQAGFAFALVCLGAIGILSYLSVSRLRDDAEWTRHTEEVISSLRLLVSHVTDAETSQRGQAIAGDESYLRPYQEAQGKIDADLESLQKLTADNAAQQGRLDVVAALIAKRMTGLDEKVELRRSQGFDAAQAATATGAGKQLQERIRGLAGEMVTAEQGLLQERKLNAERSSTTAKGIVVVGSVLALGVAAMALLALEQTMACRRAQTALRGANGELESRVTARTAELQAVNAALQRQISEREGSEEALHATEARFRRLVDSNAEGVMFWNRRGGITGANDAFLHLVGYTREDLEAGRIDWAAMTPPEFADLDRRHLEELTAQGAHSAYEKEFIRQDGSRVPILIGAATFEDNPEEGVGFVIDITERKQAEEAFRLFRKLVDQSNDSFEVIDPETGRFLDVNERGCLELGYSRAEHLALRVCDIDPLVGESEWRQVVEKMRVTGSLSREGLRRRKDGSTYPVELNAKWARLDRDYIVAVVRDITERQQAEARRREQDEAERANRAKSEFLSRMSHELRTPLHAILGFAQLLEMDGLNLEDKESVAQIIRAGKHLLELINEVLDIARVESGKLALTPEPVSVRETLEETLCLVKPLAAERGVRFEPLAGDLDCAVLSSAQRFKQVFLNLLSNAVKFNREGGTVAISGEKIEDFLRIKVADTGRGISAGNLPKLFVPFERLEVGDTVIEGTGLGLSLSKHLIEAMGGRIGVESVLGEGTTFWIELPLIQGTSAAPARRLDAHLPGVAELPRATAPRTLLCIEDNLSNLRLVERILARRPEVKLISAMQGRLGLELAHQHQPDLILLDLHLPDLQGDEILRQLRADPRTAQIPIVMISADATAAQIARLHAAGATDYLTKPIDVRSFLAFVDATAPRRVEAAPPPKASAPNL